MRFPRATHRCVHANSKEEAETIRVALKVRFNEIGLEMHPSKTRIVYCRDSNRQGKHEPNKFVFLGFEFKERTARARDGGFFRSFQPAVSMEKLKLARRTIKYKLKIQHRTDLSIDQIARWLNPIARGWLNYFGYTYKTAVMPYCRFLNDILAGWARRKFKKLKKSRLNSYNFLRGVFARQPKLFAHWEWEHL